MAKTIITSGPGTKIKTCSCPNVQQDQINGAGNRVFNKTAKKSGDTVQYRCTSCGNLK
jgi:hypothetical protein